MAELREPQPVAATPSVVVVDCERLAGAAVAEVRTPLEAAIADGRGDVVVDVRQVEWVDVAGLALLASCHRRLRAADRRLVLRGCSPRVRRALAVTRLNRVFAVEPVLGPL